MVLSLRSSNWQHFFSPHHYQTVARVLTTNLNSINQITSSLSLIIFARTEHEDIEKSSYYAFESLCKVRQHSLFLQQSSQLLHCHLICESRRFLMRFSLISSSARCFRSLIFFSLQSMQYDFLLVCSHLHDDDSSITLEAETEEFIAILLECLRVISSIIKISAI